MADAADRVWGATSPGGGTSVHRGGGGGGDCHDDDDDDDDDDGTTIEAENDGGEFGGTTTTTMTTRGKGKAGMRMVSLSLLATYLSVMAAKCALPSTLSILSSSDSGLHLRRVGAPDAALLSSRREIISRLLASSTVSIAGGKLNEHTAL